MDKMIFLNNKKKLIIKKTCLFVTIEITERHS